MYSARDLHKGGVAPFGHPRINDRSHLPAAFRSVPRPSSPLGAKASTERPSHTHSPPPARRIHPRHQTGTSERFVSNRTAAPPRTLTPHGLSAAWVNTRYHQLFFTMRNNIRNPRQPVRAIRAVFWKPATPPLRTARGSRTSPGGDRIRTDDPLLAKQVLYQLSYAPQGKLLDQPAQPAATLTERSAYGPGRT
jgi:hypothetical protein